MTLRAGIGAVAHHGMRAYYIPATAGLLLAASAFLPWVVVNGERLGGVPEIAGLWVLGLGILATTFSILSIITRRNSRHPLLVVGLASLGILFLAYQLMRRSVSEHAWAAEQARAIVQGTSVRSTAPPAIGAGLYLGLAASIMLVLFGLTIVVKRVARPYAEPEDDV
jgi:hypothetical protein